MKIASVRSRVPERRLDNDDVLAHLDEQNPAISRESKSRYLKLVSRLLEKSGAKYRHWRDTTRNESASEIIMEVIDDALASANVRAQDIDLVIYCGVGRGFLEPANAYFYAKDKGMNTANCFDIIDACMSWVRALQVAQLMLDSGACRNAMIVNGEFHFGLHDNWEIRDFRSLEYTFPMYTIGEASTATILVPSDDKWQFDYHSRPEFADLCTIPLFGHKHFVPENDRVGLNGLNNFVSFGTDLFREAKKALRELILNPATDLTKTDWFFPHAPSRTAYRDGLEAMSVPVDKIYLETFPRFGNIVSASIPAGLSTAEEEGVLKRGDSVALVPASAGLVAALVQFTF